MKNEFKKRFTQCILLLPLLSLLMFPAPVYAAEYITISIEAEDDNGGTMRYAIDTDDPAAFTESNEFIILEGTTHTIYVMDSAGNVTSQIYNASANASNDDNEINIELEIGRSDSNNIISSNGSNRYYEDEQIYAGGTGTGTVYEKIYTDGSENSEKIFYTITTKEGEVLYLIVDQGKSSNNVYLLDTVSASDLMALADDVVMTNSAEKEDNLLAALSRDKGIEDNAASQTTASSRKSSGNNMYIITFICIAAVGGIYYYFKIYKVKKEKVMDEIEDAKDLNDFEAESDEEEVEFDEFDDAEKEEFLENLISEEDDLLDADPEEYAAEQDYIEDDYDEGVEIEEGEEN